MAKKRLPLSPDDSADPGSSSGQTASAAIAKSVARTKVMQSDMPSLTLDQALRVPRAIWDDFAGKSAAPHDIAFAVNMTPTSGPWRTLTGASIAYGLTEGGYGADSIKLTQLGRRIVAPEEEGDDVRGRAEAVLKPRIMREFFQRYDRAKFPQDGIAANVLVTMGLPKERAAEAVQALKMTGTNTGILRETKTGLFVAIPAPGENPVSPTVDSGAHSSTGVNHIDTPSEIQTEEPDVARSVGMQATRPVDPSSNRVFITHGKSRAIVNQIKELLQFGNFEPVVSVERESTAVPVPDKVFHDMRECTAGVIHVNSEGEMLDSEGNKHVHLNHNVLIEIGAAIALFNKRVILLVQKGVALPSNLQGLYRCEYEGDKLDYDATMKLLKTFNEFRAKT
ncbi:putative nucleotide-binding protein [Stenotrophomonas sp. SORGH_AS282]|nr:putative nucleotide-binding protein [Stenotrophomonas sp. SORGH_AS_0282]MDQ1190345.1 putative nucleotide-binding protein [Stenotrophomonas sp. SORGH_AS_0282]